MKYLLVLTCLFAACGGDDVVDPPVSQLAFRQQPVDSEEGAPLGVISVAATDAAGNALVTASGSVHLVLGANPAGASLGGGTDAPFVDGVAIFNDVTVSAQGTAFTLVASSDVVESSATSMPFNIALGVSATASTLVVTPATVAADGIATATVTASIRSAAGAPIADRTITLQVTGSGNHLVPPSGKTDAQGMWSSHIASTTATAKTVTATIGSAQLTANIQFMPAPCTLRFPGVPTMTQGPSMVDVALADIDGDGIRDVVSLESTNLAIRLGVGDGRFQTPIRTAVPVPFLTNELGLAVGEANGDGKVDAIVATGDGLQVYFGDGTGGFAPPQLLTLSGSFRRMVLVDLDGDAKRDLVVRLENEIQSFHNQGAGTFQLTAGYPLGVMFSQVDATLETFDMNGDGKLDVITAGGTFSVLLGNGNGTFMAPVSRGAIPATGHMAIADFDGDTKPDVVFGENFSTSIQWVKGNGDGTFALPTGLFTSILVTSATTFVTDVDGDGKPDVLAVSTQMQVIRGHGDGTFTTGPTYGVGELPLRADIADLDGDGRLDLVIASRNVLAPVLAATGGTFRAPVFAGGYPNAANFAPVAGDFNGDGLLDFVGTPPLAGIGIEKAAADGSILLGPTTTSQDPVEVIGDFDGDTKLDVLALNSTRISWFRGTGAAALEAAVLSTAPIYAQGAVAARLDGGTTLDLALMNPLDDKLTVMFGSGTGTFSGGASYPLPAHPNGLIVADLDNDGDQDILVSTLPSISVFINNGSGAFTSGTSISGVQIAFGYKVMATGDLDADGKLDLAVSAGTAQIAVLRGKGDGTFFSPVNYNASISSSSVHIVDVDGDGALDLLGTHGFGVSVIRGNGNATFMQPETYLSGYGIGRSVAADLDGDGRIDLMSPMASAVGMVRMRNLACQ